MAGIKGVRSLVIAALLLSGSFVASAHASVFDFSFVGPLAGYLGTPVSGVGQFVTSGAGPDYTVTGVYGSLIDPDASGSPIAIVPGSTSTYAGADNILYFPPAITGGNDTQDYVDFGGISFLTAFGAFNLGGYSTGGAAISVLNWAGLDPGGYAGPGQPGSTTVNLIVTATDLTSPTPLPAALPLFAGGLGIIAMVSRRRKRGTAAA